MSVVTFLGNTVTAHKVHVLSAMAEDGLGLDLEHLALVLEIDVWGHCGNPVGNLDLHIFTLILDCTVASWLDAQEVGSDTGEEAAVALQCEAEVEFRHA